jgi:methylthioribose-1-phosphate isomerase
MPDRDQASSLSDTLSPLRWGPLGLELLDQTRLPGEEVWILCEQPEQVADAIRRLAIRGAPAIGVAAAYGLVLGLRGLREGGNGSGPTDPAPLDRRFDEVFALLAATRPTAVNLRWALASGRRVFAEHRSAEALLAWAQALHAEDVAINRRMGEHGARLFLEGDRVLTHCNTGALATAGYGTALGVIQSSFRQGKLGMVWVDETRPLLQGARLTAWELKRLGIPFRLITDSSAGALMARGLVDRIVVGADRIAANGDAANKIGTYTVAVLAHRHGIPFYVAAPLSTIDRETLTGADIPIEEREAHEVTELRGMPIAPAETQALNFAFDVTPNELIAGIITEVGVLTAPYTESIARAFATGGAETDR